jgi:hypothetical protein
MLQQLTVVDSVLLLIVFDYLQYAVNLAVKIYLNLPRGPSSAAPTRAFDDQQLWYKKPLA